MDGMPFLLIVLQSLAPVPQETSQHFSLDLHETPTSSPQITFFFCLRQFKWVTGTLYTPPCPSLSQTIPKVSSYLSNCYLSDSVPGSFHSIQSLDINVFKVLFLLDPLFVLLYALSQSNIVHSQHFVLQIHVDDQTCPGLFHVYSCLPDIYKGLSYRHLQLNISKTEFISSKLLLLSLNLT